MVNTIYFVIANDIFLDILGIYYSIFIDQNIISVGILLGITTIIYTINIVIKNENTMKVVLVFFTLFAKYISFWLMNFPQTRIIQFLNQVVMIQIFMNQTLLPSKFTYEILAFLSLLINYFQQETIIDKNVVIVCLQSILVFINLVWLIQQFLKYQQQRLNQSQSLKNQIIIEEAPFQKLKMYDSDPTPSQSPRATIKRLFNSQKFIIIDQTAQIEEQSFDLTNYTNPSIQLNQNELLHSILVQPLNCQEQQEQKYPFKEYVLEFQNKLQTQFQALLSEGLYNGENLIINMYPWTENDQKKYILIFTFIPSQKQSLSTEEEKSSVLTDISRSLSHELGTNLNSIIIFSKLALQDNEIDEKIKIKYLNPIRINSEQLNLIVSNIKDYNLINLQQFNLKLEQFNVKEEMKSLEKLMVDVIKNKKINLIYDFSITNALVINDKQRFRQVYFQFIQNAVKYTMGGNIKIKVENSRSQCQISISDSGPGFTQDEMEKVQNLLGGNNQFIRISKNSVGSSLGLGISNSIVKRMNGRNIPVICESNANGATFTFFVKNHIQEISFIEKKSSELLRSSRSIIRLVSGNSYIEQPFTNSIKFIRPNSIQSSSDSIQQQDDVVQQSFENEQQSKQSKSKKSKFMVPDQISLPVCEDDFIKIQEPMALSPKFQYEIIECSIKSECCSRVLIVDDEYFNILSLSLLMQKQNVKCDYAYNGKEALKQIMEKLKQPCYICQNRFYSLIFLDINMPILDGYQTVIEIKKLIKEKIIRKTWCVANTGFSDLETKIQSFNCGMDYFLTKPLDSDHLNQLILEMFPFHK